jgi:hypothetical protein
MLLKWKKLLPVTNFTALSVARMIDGLERNWLETGMA